MAVRLAAALKPVRPSRAFTMDGIDSDDESCAFVIVHRCDHATRASFDMFWPSTLFSQTLSECWFDGLIVVNPGGVTCPDPEFSGVLLTRYRPVRMWLFDRCWSTRAVP